MVTNKYSSIATLKVLKNFVEVKIFLYYRAFVQTNWLLGNTLLKKKVIIWWVFKRYTGPLPVQTVVEIFQETTGFFLKKKVSVFWVGVNYF